MTRTSRRRPYHHGNLREALVTAATELVELRGAAALTLRAVAERARVSHTAIYHHLPDREAVLAAVVEQGFAELGAAMDRATVGLTAPLAIYRALGEAYVRFALTRPRLYALMFGGENLDRAARPDLRRATRAVFDRMCNAISACQGEGTIMAGSPVAHTVFCWSATHGLVSLLVEQQIAALALPLGSPDTLAAMVIERIFTGLGARPPDDKRPAPRPRARPRTSR